MREINRSLEQSIASRQHLDEEKYWLEKLSGDWERSSFPAYFLNKDAGPNDMESLTLHFSGTLFDGLMKLRNGSDPRLFMILVAGLAAILSKYTGNSDIILGAPTLKQEIDAQFINTVLVLRNRIEDHMTFKELLIQVRQTIMEATEHQNYPVERLIELLNLSTGVEGNFPLFDVALLLENIHDRAYIEHVKVNMIFSFMRTETSIDGKIDYNSSRYKKSDIERIIDHLTRLLLDACHDVNKSVSDIDILGEEEKRRVLVDFNNTTSDYPRDVMIHELFEAQVDRNPDNIAVVCEDIPVTYRELNTKADLLARILKAKGVGPDSIVGILMERSGSMIAGMLGILKAGGAYMPIDTNYPPERIQYILMDTAVEILLVQNRIASSLDLDVKDVIEMDRLDSYQETVPRQGAKANSENLLYVIYTSGSTGKPKGTAVCHRSFVNLVYYHREVFGEDERSRMSQVAAPGFDAMAFEIWPCLTCGASLYIADDETRSDPLRLKEWLIRNEITISYQPTIMAMLLMEEEWSDTDTALTALRAAGDRMTHAPTGHYPFRLYNLYGPTEDTVWTTWAEIETCKGIHNAPVIGKPVGNHRVYILGPDMRPRPIGTAGELCIAGAGLARGYLNRPELTAEKFKHPSISLSLNPSTPLYHTGDLARWLPDGNLEFLGRIDYQFKIRGFRIELGEIENQLMNHQSVQEAVVVVKEDERGEKILCTYYVPFAGDAEESSPGLKGKQSEAHALELREYLSGYLPDYMIPHYFTALDKMPLTPNGKVDRKALPEPDMVQPEDAIIAPRDELEKELAEIWGDLLGKDKDRIGIDNNFFEHGGYSIKATQLVTRIHKKFNVKLPLAEVFRTPTIRGLSEGIKKADVNRFIPLKTADRKDYYSMSSVQKRLFILQEMDLNNIGYNASMVVLLEGNLEVERLEKTFNALLRRHESLRTSFHTLGEELVQRIHHEVEFQITYYDLKTSGENHIPRSLKEQCANIIRDFIHPFDLSLAPLLRTGIINIEEKKCLLLVDMHHIVSDGSSLGILIKEFMALYNGEQLADLKIQYKDYSEWLTLDKQREEFKRQEDFWLREFDRGVPVLNLPIDYARPPEQSFAGRTVGFDIGRDVSTWIKNFASEENTTLYVLLMAVYNVFLSKLTGQQDIVVGTGVEGRRHEDLQQIIGMFVNTLPLRNFPTGEKSFIDFLNEVKEKTLAAFENQEYPFEDLVDALVVNRDKSRNPLFDTMFQMEDVQVPEMGIPGLTLKPYPYESRISKFDLTLTAKESGEELFFSFEYCTKLFKQETIDLFIRYFKEVLSSIAADPAQSLSRIRHMPEHRKQEILAHLNLSIEEETRRLKERGQVLQARLMKSLEKFKDKIAVECGTRTLTYRQIDEHSNYIARLLMTRGFSTGTFIGVLMRDRLGLVVTMLGILKARCVFIPLDVSHPPARLQLMTESSGIGFIFTDGTDSVSFTNEEGFTPMQVEPVHVDRWFTGEEDHSQVQQLEMDYLPDDEVYIYFTSGSTGTPKAILGKNSSLLHFIDWEIDAFGIDDGFRFSQLSAPGFDAFLRDTLVPLCCGGTICIPEKKEITLNASTFLKWLESSRIHLVSCVPSLFRVLASNPLDPARLPELHVILFSGERISASDLEPWFQIFSDRIRLVNLWGTSETTLAKTFHIIRKSDLERERIPVGTGIRGAAVMVLDEHMELCDTLVTGELYLRTPFRSFGYFNDSFSNNERFIVNPFTGAPDDLIHKTGDFGRLLHDGSIDLLGRNDRQVKIRGIRIELGEIESVLVKHPSVGEAAVKKMELSLQNELLCAYLAPKETAGGTNSFSDDVKDYLSRKLPDYMVPAKFILVDKLPRTPNGKIDYEALDVSDETNDTAETVAPRNEVERHIASLWSEMFNGEPIGITDHFFQLGGNSLNVMTLISRIHRDFDVRIALGDIFNNPTVEKQASLIIAACPHRYQPIVPIAEADHYDTSYAQRRIWVLSQIEEASVSFNMPVAVILEGELDIKAFARVFDTLVERHESLRTVFVHADDSIKQKVLSPAQLNFKLEIINFEPYQAKEWESYARKSAKEASSTPFDLQNGPLVRAKLLQFRDREYLFLFNMHHIIGDYLSNQVLTREIFTLYNAYQKGEKNPLQPLPIHYKDYAAWQNQQLAGENLEEHRLYWTGLFKDIPPVLDLPLDKPRPQIQTYNGDNVAFSIPGPLTGELRNLAGQYDVTLFMIMSAVLYVFLHHYTGRTDIVIGTPIAGRDHADLANQIGVYLNTLALRMCFHREDTFLQLLEKVKTAALGAFEHAVYPFDKLVGDIGLKRDVSRHPLFDVVVDMANLTHTILPDITGDLRLIPYETGHKSCKFDLTFYVSEEKEILSINLEYNTDIFLPATIDRMMKRFRVLLEKIVKAPHTPVSDFNMEEERRMPSIRSVARDKYAK